MRGLRTWRAWALAAAVAGCAQADRPALERPSPTPPPPTSDANVMRLEATPVAASWDDRPGPDGLEVRVHFFHPGSRLPLAVNGRLEFILYEGLVADEDLDKANPFYSWKFTGQTLRPYLSLSAVGWGYVLRLAWGANAPTTSAVTLTAVYYPPSGPPVRDRAISIAVQSR